MLKDKQICESREFLLAEVHEAYLVRVNCVEQATFTSFETYQTSIKTF